LDEEERFLEEFPLLFDRLFDDRTEVPEDERLFDERFTVPDEERVLVLRFTADLVEEFLVALRKLVDVLIPFELSTALPMVPNMDELRLLRSFSTSMR
jgi:hypothetical protein